MTAGLVLSGGVARAQVQFGAADTTRMPPLPPRPAAPVAAYWVDLERNDARFSTPKAVEALLDSVADAGFGRVILDVKRRDGSVLFKSRRAPLIKQPFDVYAAFRQSCEERRLELIPRFPVLNEGDPRTRTGLAYEKPEWQTWSRVPDGGDALVRQSDQSSPGQSILLNPGLAEVQQYEIAVLKDLLTELKPRSLLLDEVRYVSAEADLGDSTRVRFEGWINLSPGEWPGSVVKMESPRYGLWRTYRVAVVREFLARIYDMRGLTAPDTRLMMAVPGLYDTGVNVGLNWAHPDFRPAIFYAKGDFRSKAVSPMFAEYVILNRDSNPRAVSEVMRGVEVVTRNSLPNGILIAPELYQHKPGRFREALQTVLAGGHGLVIHDGSGALGALGYWEILKEELAAAATRN